MSQVFGVMLCVAITIFMFAAMCIPILSWCWTFSCENHYTPLQHGGVWGDCELHDSDKMPFCNGQSLLLDANAQPNCHEIVRYVSQGHGSVNTQEGLVCETVAEAKDPLDAWHER